MVGATDSRLYFKFVLSYFISSGEKFPFGGQVAEEQVVPSNHGLFLDSFLEKGAEMFREFWIGESYWDRRTREVTMNARGERWSAGMVVFCEPSD